MDRKTKKILVDPLHIDNPLTLQVLGICSALAVTTKLETSLVMSAALTFVLVGSNMAISSIRNKIPGSVRIIVQLAIIGLCGTHHHELHRDGPRRSLCDGKPNWEVCPRWPWKRSGLLHNINHCRILPRAAWFWNLARGRNPENRKQRWMVPTQWTNGPCTRCLFLDWTHHLGSTNGKPSTERGGVREWNSSTSSSNLCSSRTWRLPSS